MKFFKKSLVLLMLVSILAFALSSCSDKKEEEAKPEEESKTGEMQSEGENSDQKPEDGDKKDEAKVPEQERYIEKLEKIKVKGGELTGILTTPTENVNQQIPVVIIVPGSGAPPKNGVVNEFGELASELVNKGIASLRYDKRGTYDSNGISVNESEIKVADYVDDVKLIIKHLKNNKRFSKFYVLGHSEGALISALALSEERVDGFISVAGAGRPIGELLREQINNNPNNPTDLVQEANTIIAKLERGEITEKVSAPLENLFRLSVQGYLIDWMSYKPQDVYAKISDIPAIIIQGKNDYQVSVQDAKKLADVLKDADLVLIDRMSHVLKDAASKDNLNEHSKVYFNTHDPINAEFVKAVINFIKK